MTTIPRDCSHGWTELRPTVHIVHQPSWLDTVHIVRTVRTLNNAVHIFGFSQRMNDEEKADYCIARKAACSWIQLHSYAFLGVHFHLMLSWGGNLYLDSNIFNLIVRTKKPKSPLNFKTK
jgi:hypothetical protein